MGDTVPMAWGPGKNKAGEKRGPRVPASPCASWLIMMETELPTMSSQPRWSKPSETVDKINLSPYIISVEYFYYHNEKVWGVSSLVKIVGIIFLFYSPSQEFHLCFFPSTGCIDHVKYHRDF